jgi:mRNA interferase MazF
MERGTIVLTLFPFTDLTSAKRRPAVVISKTSVEKADVIVAFISSVIPVKLSETDLLFDAKRKDYQNSGLKKSSVFKLDKLATLNKTIFTGELGIVDFVTLTAIDKKLKIALDLDKNGG